MEFSPASWKPYVRALARLTLPSFGVLSVHVENVILPQVTTHRADRDTAGFIDFAIFRFRAVRFVNRGELRFETRVELERIVLIGEIRNHNGFVTELREGIAAIERQSLNTETRSE